MFWRHGFTPRRYSAIPWPLPAPSNTGPDQGLLSDIAEVGDAVSLGTDPHAAIADADLVITDTWVSMGDTDEGERRRILKPYQGQPQIVLPSRDRRALYALPACPPGR